MRNILFTKEMMNEFKKEEKSTLFFLILFISLFVIYFALSIIFSTYENKVTVSVVGSILSCVFICLVISFIYKLSYIKDFVFRFDYLMNKETVEYTGEIIKLSDSITLVNNDQAKEVYVKINGKTQVFYVFPFISNDLILNKKAQLLVADDFIKEVIYEN